MTLEQIWKKHGINTCFSYPHSDIFQIVGRWRYGILAINIDIPTDPPRRWTFYRAMNDFDVPQNIGTNKTKPETPF